MLVPPHLGGRRSSRRPCARVTIEILVLALASTIRPTSLAAVYALLAHDSRRPLMFAYVVGGLALSRSHPNCVGSLKTSLT